MGVDEMLLETSEWPTLRLYSWVRPTVSLGFSQKPDWLNWDALEQEGAGAVRRPTGGRALLHDEELTYALILPDSGCGRLLESYQTITGWLASALRRLGFLVESASASVSSQGHPGCYELLQAGELMLGGRKLVGSAQARRGVRLLQHGAIPLRVDASRLLHLIPGHTPYWGLPVAVTQADLAEALLAELECPEVERRPLSLEERAESERRGRGLALRRSAAPDRERGRDGF